MKSRLDEVLLGVMIELFCWEEEARDKTKKENKNYNISEDQIKRFCFGNPDFANESASSFHSLRIYTKTSDEDCQGLIVMFPSSRMV